MENTFSIRKNVKKILFCFFVLSAVFLLQGCGNKTKEMIETDKNISSAILNKYIISEISKDLNDSVYQTKNGFIRVSGGEKQHTISDRGCDLITFSRLYHFDRKDFSVLSVTAGFIKKGSCTVRAKIQIRTMARVSLPWIAAHVFTPVNFSSMSNKEQNNWFETVFKRLPENPLEKDWGVNETLQKTEEIINIQETVIKEHLVLDKKTKKWNLKQITEKRDFPYPDQEAKAKTDAFRVKAGFKEFKGSFNGESVVWYLSPEDYRSAENLCAGKMFYKGTWHSAAFVNRNLKLEQAVMRFKKEENARNFIFLLETVKESGKCEGCKEAQKLCVKFLDERCSDVMLSEERYAEQKEILSALQRIKQLNFFQKGQYISFLSEQIKTFDPSEAEKNKKIYTIKIKNLQRRLQSHISNRYSDVRIDILKLCFLEYIKIIMKYPYADFASDAEKLLSVLPENKLYPIPENKAKAYLQDAEKTASGQIRKTDFEEMEQYKIKEARKKYTFLTSGQNVSFMWHKNNDVYIAVKGIYYGFCNDGQSIIVGRRKIPLSETPVELRLRLKEDTVKRRLDEEIYKIKIERKGLEAKYKASLRLRIMQIFRFKLLHDGYILLPNREIISPKELLKRLKEKNTVKHRISKADIVKIFG